VLVAGRLRELRAAFSEKVGVLAEFSAEGDGKPTVMRYIIRVQAGLADYWEGE
jgi:hypothetical protein